MSRHKINKEIQNQLFSANNEIVVAAVQKIRSHGNSLYIPILLDLLISNPDNEIEKEILKLLGNIKAKNAVPLLVKALQDPTYKSVQKNILTACWQNGLNYDDYLPFFVDIVINEDWETAFEAFTLIENMEHLPEPEIVESTIQKIDVAINSATGKTEYFLKEIRLKLL